MNYMNGAVNTTERSSVLTDETGLWELPEKCRCGFPMHLRSGGTIAFCPICHDKSEWAARGRVILEIAKAKAALQKAAKKAGADPLVLAMDPVEEDNGRCMYGMPL